MMGATEADTAAIIVDSGSTNNAGFRISIERSGDAELTVTRRRPAPDQESDQPVRHVLSQSTVKRFYDDLDAAKPVSSLPAVHCMKSVSFGSTRRIVVGAEQSPDLTCGDGGNEALRALIRDVNEIVELMRGK